MPLPTIEELHKRFRYDAETGEFYLRYCGTKGFDLSRPVGWIDTQGYKRIRLFKMTVPAHRLAWALHYGEWPSIVDHIDRDKANNRISNLRIATHLENSVNKAHGRGITGVKGVFRKSRGPGYRSHISADGKTKYLGSFDSIDEAAHAYNKAAIQLHGEFAVLNPIGEDK